MNKIKILRPANGLPAFKGASTGSGRAGKAYPGKPYDLVREETDDQGMLWFELAGLGWVIAKEGGRLWAARDVEAAAPVVASAGSVMTTPGPWASSLSPVQLASDWVADHQRQALQCIPAGVSPEQDAACRFFIGLFGMPEDKGSNRGDALDHFVMEYREHWQIDSTNLAWCALIAQIAQFVGLGLGNWREPADWKKHPLGDWIGASSYQEKAAVEQGLWVPVSEVLAGKLTSASACAALAIRHRRGSGSDVPPSRPDAPVDYYPGHTDLVLSFEGGTGRMHVCSGNVSDTAKCRLVKTSEYRGLVPLIGG